MVEDEALNLAAELQYRPNAQPGLSQADRMDARRQANNLRLMAAFQHHVPPTQAKGLGTIPLLGSGSGEASPLLETSPPPSTLPSVKPLKPPNPAPPTIKPSQPKPDQPV